MNFDVAVSGRPWKVAIEPAEPRGQFTVVVKGNKRVVDASWIDADTLSLISGSASREVRFHRGEDGVLGVAFDGRLFEAVVSKTGRASLLEKETGASPGAHSIKAPMPGRIVRMLVAVGDRVAARQAVVIVEAMKMENEVRAPRDGIVKEIAVVVGAPVDAGAVLLILE